MEIETADHKSTFIIHHIYKGRKVLYIYMSVYYFLFYFPFNKLTLVPNVNSLLSLKKKIQFKVTNAKYPEYFCM